MNIFSKTVSFVFHPLLLPTYVIIYIFITPSYLQLYPFVFQKALWLIVFITTFIAPLLAILLMLNLGVIKSIYLEQRKDRVLPYAVTLVFYLAASIILIRLPVGVPKLVSVFIISASINIFIIFLINFKTKISAHMSGVGGSLAYLCVFYYITGVSDFTDIIIIIFIIALVLFSRLHQQNHNSFQAYMGLLTGLFAGGMSYFILKVYL